MLLWQGVNLLPRTSHTVIWQSTYRQQSGYYAETWHTSYDGTWHGSTYEFGCHPYPTNGSIDGAGQSTGGTGGTGSAHYHEIAGLGANDFIASPGRSPLQVVNGTALWHARTCQVIGGTTLRHTYWPDLIGHPSMSIVQDISLASLATPTTPVFLFGCSPWTAGSGGSSNQETPSGMMRGFALFSTALSQADILSELASSGNSAVTSAGQPSVWYINKNPTPTDISDKSGAGHSPTWANANRPQLYSA